MNTKFQTDCFQMKEKFGICYYYYYIIMYVCVF